MDDLLVYSATPEQHLCDLNKVFHTLHQARLKVKKEKVCVWDYKCGISRTCDLWREDRHGTKQKGRHFDVEKPPHHPQASSPISGTGVILSKLYSTYVNHGRGP